MTFLFSSPYGPLRRIFWSCDECPERSGTADVFAEHDDVHVEAVAHLSAAGHRVTVSRGTVEMLVPLATSAAGSEASR